MKTIKIRSNAITLSFGNANIIKIFNMKVKDVLGKDKKLLKLINALGEEPISRINSDGKVCEHLVNAIISQQLSVKVARVIAERFWAMIGTKAKMVDKILAQEHSDLRACGLSNQKANYIINIANFWKENNIKDKSFQSMSDEEVIKTLVKIKGVGNWTAEMVLMFCLGREDVFALDDYGIQVAMKSIYNIDATGKELQQLMIKKSEKWRPYRTYACMYLWAHKDQPL